MAPKDPAAKTRADKKNKNDLERWQTTMRFASPGARVLIDSTMPGIVTRVDRTGKAKSPVGKTACARACPVGCKRAYANPYLLTKQFWLTLKPLTAKACRGDP